MATYKVEANGNAPKEAVAGDHIVTAGGTYQVMDTNTYSKYSPEQLAQEGIGYNPSSGLYSKKVNDISSNDVALQGTSTVRSATDAAIAQASAQLDSNYATDRQNIQRTYNNAVSDQLQLQNQISKDYFSNMSQLYNDTYYNNQKALEGASDRGLISSGLGNAMVTSNLANASSQNAQLRYNRDSDMNQVNARIAELAANYNVDLDALQRKLNSDKTASYSQMEVAFLQQLAEIERNNTNTVNDYIKTIQAQQYQAQQAAIERDFEARENQSDREASRENLLLSRGYWSGSGRYGRYGGYGGYRRRYGYYNSNSRKYGYGSGTTNEAISAYNNWYDEASEEGYGKFINHFSPETQAALLNTIANSIFEDPLNSYEITLRNIRDYATVDYLYYDAYKAEIIKNKTNNISNGIKYVSKKAKADITASATLNKKSDPVTYSLLKTTQKIKNPTPKNNNKTTISNSKSTITNKGSAGSLF